MTVSDSSSRTHKTLVDTIDLTVQAAPGAQPNGGPLDRPPDPGQRFLAVLTIAPQNPPLPADYSIQFTPSAAGDTDAADHRRKHAAERQRRRPTAQPLSATRLLTVNVPAGSDANPITIVVTYPAGDPWPDNFHLLFDYDLPGKNADLDSYALDIPVPTPFPDDPVFRTQNPVPSKNGVQPPGAQGLMGTQAVRFWIQRCSTNAPLKLDARASYEGHPDTESHNEKLSDRRLEVAKKVIGNSPFTQPGTSTGETLAKAEYNNGANTGAGAAIGPGRHHHGHAAAVGAGHVLNATISGKAGTPPPPPPKKRTPPPAQPQIPKPAPVFRRLSIRARATNIPVLGEISGELDFETDIEQKLRTQPNSVPNGNLGLQQRPSAQANPGPNPEDGVVDFLLNITYDTSTHFLTETLGIQARARATATASCR